MSVSPTPPPTPPPRATNVKAEGSTGLGGLVKHSLIYSLVPVFARFAGFAMIPFLWARLSEAEYGLAGIGELYMMAFAQALGVSVLHSAMSRFFFDSDDLRHRNAVISSCTLVLGGLAFAVVALCLPFREQLAPILLGQQHERLGGLDLSEFLVIVLLIIPFKLTTVAGVTYLQILKRSGLFSGVQIAKMCVEIGLKIWTIAWLGMGARGFMLSILAGEALTTVFLTGWVLWTVKPRIDWQVFAPILKYAAPLIPVGLCQVALHNMDRRLLEHLSPNGHEAVGLYTAGYQFGILVNVMVLTPFMQIWQPWIFAVKDAAQRAGLVGRVSTYAVLSVGAASLGLILFGRDVIGFVVLMAQTLFGMGEDSDYLNAYRVLPWVASGYVFWALYAISQIPLYLAKRTGPLLLINVLAVALNFGLNWWLVPHYDFVGAGMATLLTFAALAGMGMWVSHSAAGVAFELRRIALVLLIVVLGGVLAYGGDVGLRDGRSWAPAAVFAVKLGAAAALFFGLWQLVLGAGERADFGRWLRGKLGRG